MKRTQFINTKSFRCCNRPYIYGRKWQRQRYSINELWWPDKELYNAGVAVSTKACVLADAMLKERNK